MLDIILFNYLTLFLEPKHLRPYCCLSPPMGLDVFASRQHSTKGAQNLTGRAHPGRDSLLYRPGQESVHPLQARPIPVNSHVALAPDRP